MNETTTDVDIVQRKNNAFERGARRKGRWKKEISRGTRKGTKEIGSMQAYREILYREMRDVMNEFDLVCCYKSVTTLTSGEQTSLKFKRTWGNCEVECMISPTWVGSKKLFPNWPW